jgi:hypothetical protein
MLNIYEYDQILPDGRSARALGVSLKVYAPCLEIAEQKLKNEKRRNKWKGVIKLIDVKLDVKSAWNDRTSRAQPPEYVEPPTVWYCNPKIGMNLRIG